MSVNRRTDRLLFPLAAVIGGFGLLTSNSDALLIGFGLIWVASTDLVSRTAFSSKGKYDICAALLFFLLGFLMLVVCSRGLVNDLRRHEIVPVGLVILVFCLGSQTYSYLRLVLRLRQGIRDS